MNWRPAWFGMALVAGGLLTAGCPKPPPAAPPKPGLRMVGYHDIEPATAPPRAANLIIQQPPAIPVAIETKHNGDKLTINVWAHGDLFQEERYISTSNLFAVIYASETEYQPPIPLLKFPLNLGGPSYTWNGSISSDLDPHPAHATISTSPDTISVGDSTFSTIRADVDLVIDPYREAPLIKRHLSFWFEKGYGLIKRDFAGTSIRQPVLR